MERFNAVGSPPPAAPAKRRKESVATAVDCVTVDPRRLMYRRAKTSPSMLEPGDRQEQTLDHKQPKETQVYNEV